MGFIKHIPGTNPIDQKPRHPKAKGIGVVGLHEGRTLLLAAASRCSTVYPAAGCDVAAEKLEASRAELPGLFYTADYAEMLRRPDVDIVAIYTPDKWHAPQIIAAFEAGKDVICTKPVVNSFEDARAILAAGRKTGRRLMVGQSTRFFEPFRRQRAAVERGELGKVELIDAHYIHRMDWYYDKSEWVAKETDWIFLGLSHPIDLVRWYLGRVKEVSAYCTHSELAKKYGAVSPDVYIVNFIGEDGRVARAMGHYGCHELPTARNCIELMLYGAKGSSLAQYHDMKYIHTAVDNTEVTEDHLYAGRHYYFNSEVHGMHYGEFANYAEYFGKCLIEGTPNSPDLPEAVETLCVMDAARRSAREGKTVAVAGMLKEVGL